MTATSLYERMGGTSFPFPAASVDNVKLTLEPLDTLAGTLTALIQAAVNSELGAAWTKVTNSLGSSHPLYGTSPVQDTLVGHPPEQRIVQERQCQFPLLAVHRVGEAKYSKYSNVRRQRTQQWQVHYILGLLDMAGAWKVTHALHAVPVIVDRIIDRQRHPSYASNAAQFGGLCASMELQTHEAGQASFGESEKTTFHACLMVLEIVEVTDKVAGGDEETWQGGQLSVSLTNPAESATPIAGFVVGDTNPDYVPP